MDEDLLVTNAFYPTVTLTENDNTQSVRVDYNYNRPTTIPYATEQLGPYPKIHLRDDKKYDVKTANEFKRYLKKNNKIKEFDTHTNDEFLDTKLERGNLPDFYEATKVDRSLKIRKFKINVDSTFRDKEIYPNPWNYAFQLPFVIQNIKYIQLIASEIPYTASTGFSYMYMTSKAIPNMIKTSQVNFIFARIQLNTNVSQNSTVFNGFSDQTITIFDTPKPALSAIDIQLYNPDGTFYTSDRENSFSLEFTTFVDVIKNSNISSRRGVPDKTNLEQNLIL
jgi:hypothetical protein